MSTSGGQPPEGTCRGPGQYLVSASAKSGSEEFERDKYSHSCLAIRGRICSSRAWRHNASLAVVSAQVTCTASARHARQGPHSAPDPLPRLPPAMQTINRFLYGPTAEEKVRAWQAKLRAEQRVLDREMRQVRHLHPQPVPPAHPNTASARRRHKKGTTDGEAARKEGRYEVCAHHGEGGRPESQADGPPFCQ